MYIPPDKSGFYKVYECDLFQSLEYNIEYFKHQGHVILMGDFNARFGHENDFIENNNTRFNDTSCSSQPFEYESDNCSQRNSENDKINPLGRCILNMCIATGVRILNGRSANDCNGKITLYNKNGTSVIDYSIVDNHFCDSIHAFTLETLIVTLTMLLFSCHY